MKHSLGTFLVALFLLLFGMPSSQAVELAALTPENWEEFAPRGREVDAIYGDFVLRNSRIVVVVANPLPDRVANHMTLGAGGAVIDLTLRNAQNDQLTAFMPGPRQLPLGFVRVEIDGRPVEAGADRKRLAVSGDTVSLVLSSAPRGMGPNILVRYTLEEDAAWLRVESTFTNAKDEPVEFKMVDLFRHDNSKDRIAVEKVPAGPAALYWTYDKWAGQAYGVVVDEGAFHAGTRKGADAASRLSYGGTETKGITLKPGKSHRLTRRIFPGATLLDVKAIANGLQDVPQTPVTISVADSAGVPVAEADVEVRADGAIYGWGRTDAAGVLSFALPRGGFEARTQALGHASASIALDAGRETEYRVALESAGFVSARIRGAAGGPIPCKVQFRGVAGTGDPFFGPDSGEHAVHNVYYTHNGDFRQVLPPGSYEAIISHGPEYDAVFTRIEILRGKETRLEATLRRSVETPGWVSSDFHSHASPSGDNVSSQLGRVLNLLCEHIEFAPCTEHNRIDTYLPHLERLGVVGLMATCSGIELTGTPEPVNHQNAFPLVYTPRIQDGGGPRTAGRPAVQIERLALWDNASDKLVQQNHPEIGRLFFDRKGDGVHDGGYKVDRKYMDVIEVQPPGALFEAPFFTDGDGAKGPHRNRLFSWVQLFNQGYRIPGTMNTDAHANFHGSGSVRNYIKSPADDPAKIDTLEMVHASERGNIIMTNGPFLEVSIEAAEASSKPKGTAGDDVIALGGKATLHIRVQCPNWFDVDRVQVFLNGAPSARLNFTRASHGDFFSDATVKFDRRLDLELSEDTHVIVGVLGEHSKLGPVMGPRHQATRPAAVSNPIFVDVDGNGFEPNGDLLGVPLAPKRRR